MKDELFDVPETKPRWRQLQEEHGIETFHVKIDGGPGDWISTHELIDSPLEGHTEKEAVINLIHELKLPGWETLSPR